MNAKQRSIVVKHIDELKQGVSIERAHELGVQDLLRRTQPKRDGKRISLYVLKDDVLDEDTKIATEVVNDTEIPSCIVDTDCQLSMKNRMLLLKKHYNKLVTSITADELMLYDLYDMLHGYLEPIGKSYRISTDFALTLKRSIYSYFKPSAIEQRKFANEIYQKHETNDMNALIDEAYEEALTRAFAIDLKQIVAEFAALLDDDRSTDSIIEEYLS